jgi:hypothetical protein
MSYKEKKMLPEVYIIESLSKQDIKEKRLEGKLISQILRMGKRKPKYRFVKTRSQLIEATEEFAKSQYRYLHLSCHGNSNKFRFYFGDIGFRQFAKFMHDKLENRRIFISTCKSVNMNLAKLIIPRSKCNSIIGPFEPIRFDDAAIIWVSYYYLAFKNEQTVMDRKLIIKTLTCLTKLYQINLNYFSIIQKKGIKLTKFIEGKKIDSRVRIS